MLSTLFIPLYWGLISVAGFIALYELLVKPHYWQKTVHGLHLKGRGESIDAKELFEEEEEQSAVQGLSEEAIFVENVPEVAQALKMMETLPLPAISVKQKRALKQVKSSQVRDLWFVATLVTACITSVLACIYFFEQHQTLLYGDAYSHMRIARSVIDSATPGFAQLGGIWLPLPHLLMLPFIWNHTLWTTGLAGSFVSMLCYVASGAYLYLSIRSLSKNRLLSFVGTLFFLFNPNILYLQTTGLSELVCIWTLTMACYYFLLWAQKEQPIHLILAAGSTFLATLARYDGWSLFAALVTLIVMIGLLKRQRLAEILGNGVIFSVLGSFGILLWLIWNKIIFNDPLYFQHSVFSSQGIQMQLRQSGTLYAYHDAWLALKTYTLNVMQTCSPVLFASAVVGFVLFFLRRRITPEMLAALAFVTPFGLYVLSLYSGQAVIWVPGAVPVHSSVQLYNVRYGSEMVAPIALFTTILVARGYAFLHRRVKMLGQIAFVLAVLAQSVAIALTGVITLQDGQYGLSCSQTHIVNAYLTQHYAGGRILEDVSAGDYSETETGIDFKNILYDGSGVLWQQGLANPGKMVDWIIAVPGFAGDRVSQKINVNSPAFLAQFTMVAHETDGLVLYHRNGGIAMANHPLPEGILTNHRQCLVGMGKSN